MSRFVESVICVALLALLIAESASAAVVYTESFANASSPVANQPMSHIGWQSNVGPTAVDNTSSATETLIATAAGKDGTLGYGADQGTGSGNYSLIWTTEIGSINLADLQTISFFSNNATTTDSVRIALRLNNNTPGDTADDFWVATNTGFIRNSTTAGSASNWVANGELESFTFNSLAATWRDLTFATGSLSLAGSARVNDLPEGSLNAIGFFISGTGTGGTNTGVVRVDQLSVEAIPEPSSWAAGFLLVSGFIALRRRSR
jgi:hypothetical protein